ncbi:hypothetical protein NM688_g330 [Phlebia brevispora]|uniref:Uncharacterized protein n=1 Tax=Phlebia brevispora TaxID=194682 RepID=A0ACC1TEB8_9APHY|nr:hypothetical protein NM688_g330 [Phlebia brevispora]
MKFALTSLVVLAAGLNLVTAQEYQCCVWGPPTACEITGALAARAPEPSLHLGPGSECCCSPLADINKKAKRWQALPELPSASKLTVYLAPIAILGQGLGSFLS